MSSLVDAERAHALEPLEPARLRALFDELMRRHAYDRAWCTAAALACLGAADREQTAVFRQLKPRGIPTFKARLGEAAWMRDLSSPELDRAVGGVFEVVARAARALKASPPRGEPEQPGTPHLGAKAFFGAANVLGIPQPTLFVRADQPDPIVALPGATAASALGAPLLADRTVPELMFAFGKHLVLHRGEHGVRAAFPLIRELTLLLTACVELVEPRRSGPSYVQRLRASLLRELTEAEAERLTGAVATLLSLGFDRDLEVHVTRWARGSQRTALRTGLLLCGDPAVAARCLGEEPASPGDLSREEKLAEVIAFGVGESHHALRTALGIAVTERRPADAHASAPVAPRDDDDDEPTRERALCA